MLDNTHPGDRSPLVCASTCAFVVHHTKMFGCPPKFKDCANLKTLGNTCVHYLQRNLGSGVYSRGIQSVWEWWWIKKWCDERNFVQLCVTSPREYEGQRMRTAGFNNITFSVRSRILRSQMKEWACVLWNMMGAPNNLHGLRNVCSFADHHQDPFQNGCRGMWGRTSHDTIVRSSNPWSAPKGTIRV